MTAPTPAASRAATPSEVSQYAGMDGTENDYHVVPAAQPASPAPLTVGERAELDQLRLLAGGNACIPEVQRVLGPISLWSAQALQDHIDREVAAALASPQVAPEGWKLVPIEPTREMWEAVHKLDDRCAAGNHDGKGCSIEQAWDCFLDNAPAAPGAKDQP